MGEGGGGEIFLVQHGKLRALVTRHSLFGLPLSGTTFLLTSDTAALCHSSKRVLKTFLFSSACSELPFSQALDAVPDLFLLLLLLFFFFFLPTFSLASDEVERDWERKREQSDRQVARLCESACVRVCVCVGL